MSGLIELDRESWQKVVHQAFEKSFKAFYGRQDKGFHYREYVEFLLINDGAPDTPENRADYFRLAVTSDCNNILRRKLIAEYELSQMEDAEENLEYRAKQVLADLEEFKVIPVGTSGNYRYESDGGGGQIESSLL